MDADVTNTCQWQLPMCSCEHVLAFFVLLAKQSLLEEAPVVTYWHIVWIQGLRLNFRSNPLQSQWWMEGYEADLETFESTLHVLIWVRILDKSAKSHPKHFKSQLVQGSRDDNA